MTYYKLYILKDYYDTNLKIHFLVEKNIAATLEHIEELL